MTGVHVVVVHRWRAPYALYANYIDHTRHRVSYVTSEVGRESIPTLAAGIETVSETDSLAQVRPAVARLAGRFGAPAAIVALKEDDLLNVAQLNAEYELSGRRPEDLGVFRDKLTMARAIDSAGLLQPRFGSASTVDDVVAFGTRHGWPVVVKPRLGSSSEGVQVWCSDAVDPSWRPGSDGAIVQTFVDGTLLHVDGVFDGRTVGPLRVSKYLGTPLGFRSGGWVGSVEIDDPAVRTVVESYAQKTLTALADRPTVFHLEVFLKFDEAGDPYCVFVEIAARAGGAEIPFLWREVHGYDLVGEAFRLALGAVGDFHVPTEVSAPTTDDCAGLLLFPAPARRPCRITSVRTVLGTASAPSELYAEETLAVGEVVSDAPAYYEHVGGRFRFRGRSTEAVEAAVRSVAQKFSVSASHVDALGRDELGDQELDVKDFV
ncbi:acetyl-CoA carboxylase biotin carboxylase subunit family protein [Rhodococcus sp. NPDC058521]|uniref:ATP-grasp domain-containing protein n=1 Tax=Rhodococcus sp. NPDC058521 TaxID=3346536 RepID=UPI00365E4DB4